ncbi:MAG TPA: DUF4367 domain-containing protein [Firmicutes bacterium]|nr:DUF4367 domain-containing protein [Bacillota bacterium]
MKENQNNKIEAPVEPTISLDAVYEDLQSLPDYTEEELRQIIQKELKKPRQERDYALIDETSMLLDFMGAEVPSPDPQEVFLEMERRGRAHKQKVRRRFRTAMAACLTLVVLAGANMFSVSVYGENLFSTAVQYLGEGVFQIDFEKEEPTISLPVTEDDPYGIRTKCEEYGMEGVLTPTYIPEGFELKKAYCESMEKNENKKAYFLYRESDNRFSITIRYYIDQLTDNALLPNSNQDLEEIAVGGRTVYLLQQNQNVRAVFNDGVYIYVLNLTGEKEEMMQILEGMKDI